MMTMCSRCFVPGTRPFLSLALALALAACGGGGSSSTSSGGTPAPLPDARNGIYTLYATTGERFTLALDFDNSTFSVGGAQTSVAAINQYRDESGGGEEDHAASGASGAAGRCRQEASPILLGARNGTGAGYMQIGAR
jgi:hypothetical protein